MKALEAIQAVRELSMEHFEELKKDIIGDYDQKAVSFLSKTVSSINIHGGNGERDTDVFLVVTEDGWARFTIETESSTIPNNYFEVLSANKKSLSDQDVEDYFNSENCTINEVNRFLVKYHKLREQYPRVLKDISIF